MTSSRKNKKPIFIVAFARGGSNILLNLLRSHPDVVAPRGELQEVFKGKKKTESLFTRLRKIKAYTPILLREKKDILSVADWSTRPQLNSASQQQFDRVLYNERFKATDESQNKFKTENTLYTKEELRQGRLLSKNLNGLVFLSSEMARLYPDATFIALVRNAYAVCEGHMRRGNSIEYIANNYQKAVDQILYDAEHIPNYHVYRYEDLIDESSHVYEDVLKACQLDLAKLDKVRLQTKKVINATGTHQNFQKKGAGKELVWYSLKDYFKHFISDANTNQINRLSAAEKNYITKACGKAIKHFGYELPS